MAYRKIPTIDSYVLREADRLQKLYNSSLTSFGTRELNKFNSALGVAASALSDQLKFTNHIAELSFPKIPMLETRNLAALGSLQSSLYSELEKINSITDKMNKYSSIDIVKQSATVSSYIKLIQDSKLESLTAYQDDVANSLSQISLLPSFEKLLKLKNSPFEGISELEVPEPPESDVDLEEHVEGIEEKISEELEIITDFNLLSDETKKVISYIYHFYILQLLLNVFLHFVLNNAETAQEDLHQLNTPTEVRTFVRTPSKKFSHAALSGYRVTTALNLKVRDEPSMKADTIDTIPLGTLVDVIDKTNRSWLLVEVEINGELVQGWIGRIHTKYFK